MVRTKKPQMRNVAFQPNLEEWERDVLWLVDAKKTRDGPLFWFHVRHSVKFGRVEEIKGSGSMGSPVNELDAVKSIKREGRPADSTQAAAIDAAVADPNSVSTDGQNAEQGESDVIQKYLTRQKKDNV